MWSDPYEYKIGLSACMLFWHGTFFLIDEIHVHVITTFIKYSLTAKLKWREKKWDCVYNILMEKSSASSERIDS